MGLLSKLLGREHKERIGFEKESLAAGMAAGYSKKTIDVVDENTRRIVNILEERLPQKALSQEQFEQIVKESSIVEKDIAGIRASLERLPEVIAKLDNVNNRLRAIPESHEAIRSASESLRPSQSMIKIFKLVKERGEISFKDLAEQLGMSVPGVRGLISKAKNRGLKLETFTKDKEGWVKVRE